MSLSEVIKKYRTENKLTMEEFAKRVGVSKAYISMLEKNQNSTTGKPIKPSLETLNNIAMSMGISLDELLNRIDPETVISLKQNATAQTPQGYYTDPEAAEYAEYLRTDAPTRVLFDAAKDLSKEQMEDAVNYIHFLKSKYGKGEE